MHVETVKQTVTTRLRATLSTVDLCLMLAKMLDMPNDGTTSGEMEITTLDGTVISDRENALVVEWDSVKVQQAAPDGGS